MTNDIPTIRLKIARRSSHPWIFQKMVEKPAGRLPGGTVVDILDREGPWVGRGFYNGHSRITLRVLTTDPAEAIDAGFFARRIERAVALRRDWLKLDAVSDAYRLVHSEADGLSGLVVDRFYQRPTERPRGSRSRFQLDVNSAAGREHPGAFDDDAIALATRVDHACLAQHFELRWRGRHSIVGRTQH